MANRIQLRRDTADNWTRVNPVLDDGEPGLDITTNQIKYGDGNTAWSDLAYAGGGLAEVDGLVSFPGDLLIGTLWPDDPLPGDKESVIWAKDDTEYLGMWWGGDQIYPENNYGPVAGIMIGSNDDGSLTDDFTENASPVGTTITLAVNGDMETKEWIFDRDGNTTFPNGIKFDDSEGNTFALDSTTISSINLRDDQGRGFYTDNGGFIIRGNGTHGWTFDTDGDLTLPAGGEIHSNAGTGAVDVQSNDGSNNFSWSFTTHGSITMPELLSGAQGYGSLDANNNKIALTTNDTVDFAGFSGMILVNTHNGGGVSLYLCGGGSGDAVAIGSSKVGNAVGSMAFNSGIAGYTFTADETGDHVFFAIRTRTGG